MGSAVAGKTFPSASISENLRSSLPLSCFLQSNTGIATVGFRVFWEERHFHGESSGECTLIVNSVDEGFALSKLMQAAKNKKDMLMKMIRQDVVVLMMMHQDRLKEN